MIMDINIHYHESSVHPFGGAISKGNGVAWDATSGTGALRRALSGCLPWRADRI